MSQENNISVQETQFKDNNEIWSKILALKRIQKYRADKKITAVIFSPEEMGIARLKYEMKNDKTVWWKNSKLLFSTDFADQ